MIISDVIRKSQIVFQVEDFISPVERLDLNFGFKTREGAAFRLNFCGREAILSWAQSQNMPILGRESRDIGWAQSNLVNFGRKPKHRSSAVEKYPILLKKIKA